MIANLFSLESFELLLEKKANSRSDECAGCNVSVILRVSLFMDDHMFAIFSV